MGYIFKDEYFYCKLASVVDFILAIVMIVLIVNEVHLEAEVAIPLLLIILAVNLMFAVLHHKENNKNKI